LDALENNKAEYVDAMKKLDVDGTARIVDYVRKRTEFLAKEHEF
jgi:hypothetical protein